MCIWKKYTTFAALLRKQAVMVESVDTKDLKSFGQKWLCGFKSHSRYKRGRSDVFSFLLGGLVKQLWGYVISTRGTRRECSDVFSFLFCGLLKQLWS